jgi:hypothetical protein
MHSLVCAAPPPRSTAWCASRPTFCALGCRPPCSPLQRTATLLLSQAGCEVQLAARVTATFFSFSQHAPAHLYAILVHRCEAMCAYMAWMRVHGLEVTRSLFQQSVIPVVKLLASLTAAAIHSFVLLYLLCIQVLYLSGIQLSLLPWRWSAARAVFVPGACQALQ